jgi:hypothetical protein
MLQEKCGLETKTKSPPDEGRAEFVDEAVLTPHIYRAGDFDTELPQSQLR